MTTPPPPPRFMRTTIGNGSIYRGDCLVVLRAIEENSIGSLITDPPYGLSFMGKDWDHGVPGTHFWKEAIRVAKPGAHLLAFGGTRTFHRLAVAIEDAGWEIRDTIMWVYGSGFPKSLDVSKAIDKAAGMERVPTGRVKPGHEGFANRGNLSSVQSFKGTLGGEGGFSRPWMDDPVKVEAYHQETAPATEDAKQWDGWGTALKPAWEPIIVARKPLEGTVAINVLRWGTGGINVDACRIESGGDHKRPFQPTNNISQVYAKQSGFQPRNADGRWPANVIHDGSDEVMGLFPTTTSGKSAKNGHKRTFENMKKGSEIYGGGRGIAGTSSTDDAGILYGDSGSAARFFYCVKASASERGQTNKHPTVKPLELMKYLCRLVTPPGEIVLDMFAGSGSTLIAARECGLAFTGIEISPEYIEIIKERLSSNPTHKRIPPPVSKGIKTINGKSIPLRKQP